MLVTDYMELSKNKEIAKERFKICIVFGTRPEAIKMIPLIKELKKDENLETLIVVTGQHREMLDQVLEKYDINPDIDLNLMSENQSLASLTSKIISSFNDVLLEIKPKLVLVHGDTTTAMSVALSSFYNKINVGHVEAGLRSNDIYSPFPEEMNRSVITKISSIHFAPTEFNKKTLMSEGVSEEKIFVTGNTVIDNLKFTAKEKYVFNNEELNKIDFEKKIILVTAHRRENIDTGIENLCKALKEIALRNENIQIIYVSHMNPKIKEILKRNLNVAKNIKVIEPIDVEDSHNLIKRSYLILSDSGGIQEEAPYFEIPVLVLRDTTERQEAIENNTAKLIGMNKEIIIKETEKLLNSTESYNSMTLKKNLFGDGNASKYITKAIKEYFEI